MNAPPEPLPRRTAVIIFLAFAGAYFLSALLRAVTATLSPVLTAEFSLHARDLGLLAGGYFLGFAAVQLPLGAWLDRHGPKKVILGLLSVAVLGCVAFALAGGFSGLMAARLLMGVGVAVFILISGWGLVMDTLSPLLGESPSEDLVEHIEQTVMGYPGVLGVHDLMVHDYGPGHQFASIHVELPAEQDPLEAHDLIDNIERDFMKHDHLMVTIHYDPIVTSDAAVGVLRSRLTEKLRQLDPALSLHDLRIVPGKTHTNVFFDLVLPAGYAGDKVELLTQMEQFIKQQDPAYNCIIKLEQSYTAAAHK